MRSREDGLKKSRKITLVMEISAVAAGAAVTKQVVLPSLEGSCDEIRVPSPLCTLVTDTVMLSSN